MTGFPWEEEEGKQGWGFTFTCNLLKWSLNVTFFKELLLRVIQFFFFKEVIY